MGGPAGGESGLGPMGELHLLVAALRSDQADVESYARILSETFGDALPPRMVEVKRRRGLGDRLSGRDGRAVELRVSTPDRRLELTAATHGGVHAEIHHVVHDVVISRRTVEIEEWLAALAAELTTLADRDMRARQALSRLLDG